MTSFLAMVVISVAFQAPSAWFVVLLAVFAILVISLTPWVMGN